MALIDTIQTTDATRPSALNQVKNGQLPADWLRSFDGTTRDDFKMFVPVSYAMQALHIAAAKDGITLRTTGRYRSYARQEALFRERYKPGENDGCGSKTWQGQTWYLQRSDKGGCYAMAAVPGTSNHGWGIADDFSEWDEGDPSIGSSLDLVDLQWLANNARSFGFALDIRSEQWHWHWYMPSNPNTLTQRTVDTLKGAGVAIPDLSRWGFTVPGAGTTPPPVKPPAGTPRVAKSGGTATSGWTGWYSINDAKTRIALTSMPDAQHMTVTLHAVDAKTLKPPADPMGWTDVYWTNNEAELNTLLGPIEGSTPPPPPPPPPTPPTGTFNYTVVAGDTLWELAERFGTSVSAIKTANGLTSDTIQIGQVLKIPGKVHTVVAGDTLWELAETYDTTVAAIKELNGLTSDTIQIGQVLRIPS